VTAIMSILIQDGGEDYIPIMSCEAMMPMPPEFGLRSGQVTTHLLVAIIVLMGVLTIRLMMTMFGLMGPLPLPTGLRRMHGIISKTISTETATTIMPPK